jgi:hypothetical protein
MRESTVRRVGVAPREVIVIPLRLVPHRESSWDRLRQHVPLWVSRESVSEAILVIITLGLVGVLFACLHRTIQPPTPPTGLPPGSVFLP